MNEALYERLWQFTLDNQQATEEQKDTPEVHVIIKLYQESGMEPKLDVSTRAAWQEAQDCILSAIKSKGHPLYCRPM